MEPKKTFIQTTEIDKLNNSIESLNKNIEKLISILYEINGKLDRD